MQKCIQKANKLRKSKSTDTKQYCTFSNPRKTTNPLPVDEFYNTEIDLPNITDSIQKLDHKVTNAEILKIANSLKRTNPQWIY